MEDPVYQNPKPTNVDRFCVCLHEVKHIIDGNKGKRFEQEFDCDMYALRGAEAMGYDTAEWKLRMRWHSLSRVAMATNRGLHIDKIPARIREYFSDVDFSTWNGKRVFVSYEKTTGESKITIERRYRLEEVNDAITRWPHHKKVAVSQYDDSTYGEYIVRENNSNGIGLHFTSLNEVVKHYQLCV